MQLTSEQLQALQDQLAHFLTEPLTICALADYFEVSRFKMADKLQRMQGVQRFDSFWRVPLGQMPPKYLLEVGIIKPLLVCVDS